MKRATDYQNKVIGWAAGRSFLYLSSLRIEKNRPQCDACGSRMIRTFKLIEDQKENCFLLGGCCFNLLFNKGQITSDARMSWKNSPYYRDIDAIEQRVITEKQKVRKI
jgi:hypothetical protein